MEEEQYITPVQIRDYVFCPTIFYYKHVIGLLEPLTEAMDEGLREFSKDASRWQERKTLLNSRRIRIDKMFFGYPITCRRYKLRGVVDTIYWSDNKLNVMEIKSGSSAKLYPDHLYQTATYALMVEEEFKQTVYKVI
ncbi:MAG: PD-(D/E)XK nuclease family protein, partial [Aigarchaeota archaeon]|nr:PD-(D/E)XK nuclease family protein [Aigarchaeota archaeon]